MVLHHPILIQSQFPLATQLPQCAADLAERKLSAPQLLKAMGLSPSTSEASRMVEQGGVRVNGQVVSDKGLKLEAGSFVLQVGKRKFARVQLN